MTFERTKDTNIPSILSKRNNIVTLLVVAVSAECYENNI